MQNEPSNIKFTLSFADTFSKQFAILTPLDLKKMSPKKGLFGLLNIESIVEHFYGFIDSKIEIIKIETKAEIAKVIARGIIVSMIALFSLFFLLFISFYFADQINHAYPGKSRGYLYVSLFYIGIGLILIISSKIWGLDKKLQELFINLLDKKDEHN